MKKYFKFFIDIFAQYMEIGSINNTMIIKKINRDNIEIFGVPASSGGKLYVVKLEADNNFFYPLNLKNITKEIKRKDYAKIFYTHIKKGNYQATYFATFDKETALGVAQETGTKLLNEKELIEYILDIFFINSYYFDEYKYILNPLVNIQNINEAKKIDEFYSKFSSIISEGVQKINSDFNLYQVISSVNKTKIYHHELYHKDFNGMFMCVLDFSHNNIVNYIKKTKFSFVVTSKVNRSETGENLFAKNSSDFLQEFEDGNIEGGIFNAIIIADKQIHAKQLADGMGFEIIEKKMAKLNIMKKSLIISRDLDFDFFLDTEQMKKFLGMKNKKLISEADLIKNSSDTRETTVDFYGEDIFNSNVNFSFRMNTNPYMLLFGKSGTGKSVTMQKMIQMMFRYDVKTNIMKDIDKKNLRYFDVGFSTARWVAKLEKDYANKIGIFESNPSKLQLGLFNMSVNKYNEPAEEDLIFVVKIMNIALESSNMESLSLLEAKELKGTIKKLYKKRDFKKIMLGSLTQKALDTNGVSAYDKLVNRLYSMGYDEYTTVDTIKEDEFDFLKKPTMESVLMHLELKMKSEFISKTSRHSIETLISKLRGIDSLKIFSYYDSFNIDDKALYFCDFQYIKENQELFMPVFFFLVYRFFKKDSKKAFEAREANRLIKPSIYVLEEGKNFMKYKSSRDFIEVMYNEGRKAGIHIFFLTQMIDHVPDEILEMSATKVFLVENKTEEKRKLKDSISKRMKTSDEIEYVIDNLKPHQMAIVSSKGTFACKMQVSNEELEIFETSG